ncbi:uncharacterized protein N0V89_012604 [Didymosphaeria variabile]|uniref:Heterokaryon incompatibility domain-containing protein n=1 Tax=Didymosphaeria variabile TaxID=1932322 RepID=A0A9W8XAZ0_9PLEO|nr:uncharacterized protein N0V89_012604 [Didymosphaeria variabile]KAJ4344860.1 hypothetical protein N0V89_012604 [Didymosphaeria variabile]
MGQSEWFTRGWTLQELLAPKGLYKALVWDESINVEHLDVYFFDAGWNLLGDRLSLVDSIHEATNIRKDLLRGEVKLHDCSIAERMSWAARRTTKCIEDRAYSLFGIFQVHLPMLYGEREAAFQRLQQAILKFAEDDTLFAWTGVSTDFGGLLAPNLEAFRDGAKYRASAEGPNLRISGSDATERRIGFTTHLYPWCTDTYVAFLGCERIEHGHAGETNSIVGIYLRTLKEDDDFARVEIDGKDMAFFTADEYLALLSKGKTETRTPYKPIAKKTWMMERSISVRQLPLSQEHQSYLKPRVYGFSFSMPVARHLAYFIDHDGALVDHMKRQHNVYNMSYDESTSRWDPEKGILWAYNGAVLERGIIGTLKSPHFSETRNQSKTIRDIHFGFDHFFNPTLFIRHNELINAKENIDNFCDKTGLSDRSVVLYEPKSNGGFDAFGGFGNGFNADVSPKLIKPNEEANFWTETSLQRSGDLTHPERNFWAFKGDRQSGLDTCLTGLTGWEGARTRLTKLETSKGLVWDLEMDEYGGDFARVVSGSSIKKKKKSRI